MSVPNNSPATAITITEAQLPKTITLDMSEVDPTDGAWYKLTIPSRMYLLGMRASNSAWLDNIQPYSDAGITPTSIACSYTDLIQLTVEPASTYYFKVISIAGAPLGSNATVTFTGCPTSLASRGDLCITDDLDDDGEIGGVILDTTGNIRRSIVLSPGEAGDRLPGLLLFDYRATLGDSSKLKLYNNNFDLITEFASPFPTQSIPIIRSDQDALFYFFQVSGGTTKVYTVDRDGTLANPFTFAATSFNTLCPDIESNILYYALVNTNQPVKRWDIVNDTGLTNFLAGVVNYRVAELAILPDGNIVVVYISSVDSSGYIKVFQPDGTLVSNFNPAFDGTTWRFDHICRTFEDGQYWVRLLNVNAITSKFQLINAADASIISQFTTVMFDGGVSEDNTTSQNFGPSSSCTLLVVEAEYQPLSGIYYLLTPTDVNAAQRRHDTLYTAYDPVDTENVQIPDPFIESAYIGDE